MAGAKTVEAQAAKRAVLDTPLCVDLDGTLIRSDMLVETAVQAIRQDWTHLLRIPLWLLRGKAHLKMQLALATDPDPSILPYHTALLDYLREERDRGRKVVLVTASDQRVARTVADHVGVFDDVIASDGTDNLKGVQKAAALERRYGAGKFTYAGNERSDLPVWRAAHAAVVVNGRQSLQHAAESVAEIEASFPRERTAWLELLKAMRCYQWVKNVLVFVPALTAHSLFEPGILSATVTIFFAFCLAASGTYIINDLLDLSMDRRHPRKRLRPFASGTLPIQYGVFGPLLVIGGVVVGAALSPACGGLIGLYAVTTTAYSIVLKKMPLVDVFVLAGLYSLRLFTGGVASDVSISIWLLSFSGFLFLGLAFLKRTAELAALQQQGLLGTSRRGYVDSDADMLRAMGVSCSFLSSLVLALYVDSAIAGRLYVLPEALWSLVPLLLFWQCRLWLATGRGYMHDDPIVYAAKDRVSWVVFGAVALAYFLATVGGAWS